MLPECNDMNGHSCACIEGFRYVDCSIRNMLEELHSLAILNDEIEVKMFGGSSLREIIFIPKTGQVFLKKLKRAEMRLF